MKQHVPQPDPGVSARMQISDIISHLLMGPDRGRITQSAPDGPTGCNKGSPTGQPLPPQPPRLHRPRSGLPTSSRSASRALKW